MTKTITAPRKHESQLARFEQAAAEIDRVVEQSNLVSMSGGRFSRAFVLASAVQRLEALITPEMMADIMRLQGNPLGFRTDRDEKGGYDVGVVKRCLIEALLRGAYPIGGELCIIAGRPYLTKQFFERAVREFPGLTNLRLGLGVPKSVAGGAIVKCAATWKREGEADTIEAEIPVRVNSGMGVDAILGKATRKLLARIYQRLTGSDQIIADGDVGEPGPEVETIIAGDGTAVIDARDEPGDAGDGAQGEADDVGIVTVGNVIHAIIEGETGWDAARRSAAIARWCEVSEIDPQKLADESDGSDDVNAIIEKAKQTNWEVYVVRK